MSANAEIKNGLGQLSFGDDVYIVCPIHDKENTTIHYLNGDVPIPEEGIESFRLVAIKSISTPTPDGHYPMCQLICHVVDGKVLVDRVMEVEYDGNPVFFDDANGCVVYVLDNIYGVHYEKPYLWEYSVKDLRKSPWIETKDKGGDVTKRKSIQLRHFEGERCNRPDIDDSNQWSLNNTYDALNELKLRPDLPTVLCHYVSKGKSSHVLKPQADIYCGHTSCQNDPCEICTGCSEFIGYCRKMQLLPSFHLQILMDSLRYNLISPQLKGLPFVNGLPYNPPAMPSVFCTTPNDDSPYQWRNYTDKKDGGYCFCFDFKKLNEAIRMQRDQYKDSVLILSPCFYVGQDDDAIEQIFAALVKDLQQDISIVKDTENPSMVCQQIWERIQGAVITVAPLIKHHRWAHEKEWRVVLIRGCNLSTEQYLPSNLSKVCEHPINLMTAIKVSPQGDALKLREYIESLNENASRLVTASKVNRTVVEHYIQLENDKLDTRYEEYVLRQPIGGEVMSQEEFLTDSGTTKKERT